MAKTNYSYEKRQQELKKQKKRQEKLQKKRDKKLQKNADAENISENSESIEEQGDESSENPNI